MLNELIINNLSKLIRLTEIEIDNNVNIKINNFRLSSLKKIIKIISKLSFNITNINQIDNIEGIGKKTINRIDELLKTGKLKELKNYEKYISKYEKRNKIINELTQVIGIGRILANKLINDYNIKSINHLKQLILLSQSTIPQKDEKNKIYINDKIKLGLKYLGKFEGNIPRKETNKIYDLLNSLTNSFNKSCFITICGSYRRELNTSSDIDILLCNLDYIDKNDINNCNLLKEYILYLHKKKFLIEDITYKDVITKYMGFCKLDEKHKIRRIDIRYVPLISYYPALMYFTGSYEFNRKMRKNAIKLGFKLNEYELYDINKKIPIMISSEQEIFDILKMNYLTPKER